MKTNPQGKATKIKLLSFKAPHMRTFHLSWLAFFFCFFGWFGIAPLMAVVREELGLSQSQIGNIIIASVAMTVFARLFIGWLVDKIGPRISYTWLLILGSLPVLLIGLSNSYESFLFCRLLIGMIGASFVISQYHTSVMFAPNVVGTANATSAGWGNLGGGVTQMLMPIIFALLVSIGFMEVAAWRWAMVVPGIGMLIMGFLYWFYTQDTPHGNLSELRKTNPDYALKKEQKGATKSVYKDKRVWALFLIYGACFGMELTINNIGAIYFKDYFDLDLKTAGIIAGLFGLMNLFARTLGGYYCDKAGVKFGLNGRVKFLFYALLFAGIALIIFSQMKFLPLAIAAMMVFGLFTQMSSGATYSVVPFINRKAMGAVAGIVGAGGNAGAVAAGFLFKEEGFSYPEVLFVLGIVVTAVSFLVWTIRFTVTEETEVEKEMDSRDVEHSKLSPVPVEA